MLGEQCTITICQPFATTFLTRLPRELRDQIYDYLWDRDSVDCVDEEIFQLRYEREWNYPAPFFADAKFMGDAFAREAATWLFLGIKKSGRKFF